MKVKHIEYIKSNYGDYSYFTLKIKAITKDGKTTKKCTFPDNWQEIKQQLDESHNAVAIKCGRPSNVYCIDYDNPELFKQDVKLFPDELTNNYETTRKGYHIFFKCNDKVLSKLGTRNLKDFKMDFLGENKVVFTYPTSYRGEDGTKYKYEKVKNGTLKEMSDALMQHYYDKYLQSKTTTTTTPKTKIKDSYEKIISSNLNNILNGLFSSKCNWNAEEANAGNYKITHDDTFCLIDKSHNHTDKNHSCIFINASTITLNCWSHNKKSLKKAEQEKYKELRQELQIYDEPIAKEKEEKISPFEFLVNWILEDAKENQFKKESGFILKRKDNIPTFFEEHMEYLKYMNHLCITKGTDAHTHFRSRARMTEELVKYLTSVNDMELPFLERDPKKVSFNNGYLDIDDLTFHIFEDKTYEFSSCVYLNKEFDVKILDMPFQDIQTPLFDKVVKHHIKDNEVYQILLAMIGRLFFAVNERDNWQNMIYIKGQANTGKSTIVEIIQSLFNNKDVGTISSNLEAKFGLQNLYDKKLVVAPDLPQDITNVLDRVIFQSMISGENISIPRKSRDALSVKWNTPLIFAANFLPNYKDQSGSVSRRLAIFDMGKKIIEKDTTLKKQIVEKENHLILVKSIKAYNHYLAKFGSVAFEDWGKKFGIKYFDEMREEFKLESDYLYMFLTAPPGSNKTSRSNLWVEFKEGDMVELDTFKKKFKSYVKFKHDDQYKWSNTSDNAILENLGYHIKRIHICASCGKKANTKCCKEFRRENRRQKYMVLNMALRNEVERLEDDD